MDSGNAAILQLFGGVT